MKRCNRKAAEHFAAALLSAERTAALYDAKQRDRECDDEEEIEDAAHRVRGCDAEQPHEKKHDDDGRQHEFLFLSIVAIIGSAAAIGCALLDIAQRAPCDTL
jgi:phosphoglycerate dehydrogenase-like enzyme